MGTSVTNVTKEILKFKVAPDSGHRQEFYPSSRAISSTRC